MGRSSIHGELLMLGIDVAQWTVPNTWCRGLDGHRHRAGRPFLRNHAAGTASIDFFVVPTAFFKLLYALVILGHERRRLIGFGIIAHPTAEWIARQVTEAFPSDTAPRYLICDRDAFGPGYTRRVRAMPIRDRPTAPRSPWQNGHAERLIGSIRRDCLDHVIVFGETHLRRVLKSYASYYNQIRTHLALNKNAPEFRQAQQVGAIVAWPLLGGLHQHYVRV
jgi:transposase InsO family protein